MRSRPPWRRLAVIALDRAHYADRALRARRAMERRFRRRDGLYRRSGWLGRLGLAEHLWPVARALVADLDLAGIGPDLTPGFAAPAVIAGDLAAIERYWDPAPPRAAYASDVPGTPFGGDRYHDDNAWMGLALVQAARQQVAPVPEGRATALFAFARGGWDTRDDVPHPGGVFWIEQGRGTGRRNHDRNTISNAPNAQLGLHLDAIEGGERRRDDALAMLHWAERALRAPNGLYWDKLRGDGSVDRAQWSYNQGSVIGAGVLLARAGAGELSGPCALAAAALDAFADRYFAQAPAFNAIFFRNLLALAHAVPGDPLAARILATLRAYADEAWARRNADDLLPRADGRVSLLDQSALVSVQALLAWDPGHWGRLA